MKIGYRSLIDYKGKDIALSELAVIGGKTYGAISSMVSRYPLYSGEQILAHKPRMEETYKGVTLSLVEWADKLDISINSFRIKCYAIGTVKAIDYYSKGEHLNKKRGRYRKAKKSSNIDKVDMSVFEFDINLHAQRLIDSGLSYTQVSNRMISAGLL